MSVANPQKANDALDALQDEKGRNREDGAELQETRAQLEQPVDLAPDDAAPETEDDAEETPGFAMTTSRRVGSVALPVEDNGRIRFGKPSGRASGELLEPIEEMERSGEPLTALQSYVWATLAAWSIDDEYDVDFWADEVGMIDAVTVCRNVALGGNA